ncbi:hypothetical protein DRP07_02465 [Archaeoglobales archaeon]|nr:MAG: hypothetical protein DRP07_02465 [Archaeoglobales archaeon]
MMKMTKNSKLFFEVGTYKLKGTSLKILKILANSSLYQRQIARDLGMSESTINYQLAKLDRLGLLNLTKRTKPKFASLTEKGKRFVFSNIGISLENVKIYCHNIQLTAGIIKRPKRWNFSKPVFKAVSDELHMKGWKNQASGRWRDNFFLVSDSSVTLRLTKRITTTDPIVGAYTALDIFSEFAQDLESVNPGLKLGKAHEGSVVYLSSQEYAMNLPNIKEFTTPIYSKKFHIDWSKGLPEIDFVDNSTALNDTRKFQNFVNDLIPLIINNEIDLDLIRIKNLRKLYEFCKMAIPNQPENG